jgi:hypothetical protein
MFGEFRDTNKAVDAFYQEKLIDGSLNVYDSSMRSRYIKGFIEITLDDARKLI